MARVRFKKQDTGSFFGEFIYDRVVRADHFLRKLNAIVDWKPFTEQLVEYYGGGGMYGRPPYDPTVVLKMLLIAYLYNLSERQTEQHVNDSLAMKWFLGLAVDEAAPDHSTLSKFRQRLKRSGRADAFEEMLTTIVHQAQQAGVEFGSIQILDSSHTVANVNTSKDNQRQERDGKPPRDGDARWGVKHTKRERNEEGKVIKRKQYFYGYKAHVSMNTNSELITSLTVTSGERYDGHQLPVLLEQDLDKEIPIETVTGDRGYDDSANHYLLETKGIHSAIILNNYRTKKKDPNKQVWIRLKASDAYQAGIRERYKIERKFGEAKQGHGLGRCRYLGIDGYKVQAYMTALALNLKRMVKLLTGTNFRGRANACV
jgi:IS5 family transposase